MLDCLIQIFEELQSPKNEVHFIEEKEIRDIIRSNLQKLSKIKNLNDKLTV